MLPPDRQGSPYTTDGRPDVVRFPFGALYPHIAPSDTVDPFTYEGSKASNPSFYNPAINPQHPYTFDLLTFPVPKHQVLVVLGYSFGADRLGGVGPYDTQPVEIGRMRSSWVFDVNVSGARPDRVIHYEVVPTPIVQAGAGTGLVQRPLANAFAQAPAREAQAIGGAGLAGLPFDGRTYGAERAPFTLMVPQGRTIAVRVSIIRPLSIPLASIRGRVDGFLFPVTLYEKYATILQPLRYTPSLPRGSSRAASVARSLPHKSARPFPHPGGGASPPSRLRPARKQDTPMHHEFVSLAGLGFGSVEGDALGTGCLCGGSGVCTSAAQQGPAMAKLRAAMRAAGLATSSGSWTVAEQNTLNAFARTNGYAASSKFLVDGGPCSALKAALSVQLPPVSTVPITDCASLLANAPLVPPGTPVATVLAVLQSLAGPAFDVSQCMGGVPGVTTPQPVVPGRDTLPPVGGGGTATTTTTTSSRSMLPYVLFGVAGLAALGGLAYVAMGSGDKPMRRNGRRGRKAMRRNGRVNVTRIATSLSDADLRFVQGELQFWLSPRRKASLLAGPNRSSPVVAIGPHRLTISEAARLYPLVMKRIDSTGWNNYPGMRHAMSRNGRKEHGDPGRFYAHLGQRFAKDDFGLLGDRVRIFRTQRPSLPVKEALEEAMEERLAHIGQDHRTYGEFSTDGFRMMSRAYKGAIRSRARL